MTDTQETQAARQAATEEGMALWTELARLLGEIKALEAYALDHEKKAREARDLRNERKRQAEQIRAKIRDQKVPRPRE